MADKKNDRIHVMKELESRHRALKSNKMRRKEYSGKEIHGEFSLLDIKYWRMNGGRRCIVCALPLENCLCDMIHEAGD